MDYILSYSLSAGCMAVLMTGDDTWCLEDQTVFSAPSILPETCTRDGSGRCIILGVQSQGCESASATICSLSFMMFVLKSGLVAQVYHSSSWEVAARIS